MTLASGKNCQRELFTVTVSEGSLREAQEGTMISGYYAEHRKPRGAQVSTRSGGINEKIEELLKAQDSYKKVQRMVCQGSYAALVCGCVRRFCCSEGSYGAMLCGWVRRFCSCDGVLRSNGVWCGPLFLFVCVGVWLGLLVMCVRGVLRGD